jgi:two-component system sensor histidine kinase KdpD
VDTQDRRSSPGVEEPERTAAGPGKKPGISDFLPQSRILIWEGPALKEEVLRGLARAACDADADAQGMYDRLQQRERESSTFFNEGVAFPHLRLEDESLPRIALGIIPKGIADVPTVEPVRLVFLIVTSLRQSDIQAKLLAAASKIAGNKRLVDALLAAIFPETAGREIEQWEKQDTSPDGK